MLSTPCISMCNALLHWGHQCKPGDMLEIRTTTFQLCTYPLPVVVATGQHRKVFSCRSVAQHKAQVEDARLLISDAQPVSGLGVLCTKRRLHILIPGPVHELAMCHLSRQIKQHHLLVTNSFTHYIMPLTAHWLGSSFLSCRRLSFGRDQYKRHASQGTVRGSGCTVH